jgi:hypothetical protein
LLDGGRSFHASLDRESRANTRVLRDLDRTLNRLRRLVADRA